MAMAAGVVLLDEENILTSAYFVPFVHFAPFATQYELAYAIKFFSENPESARRIGAAASAFCREHYSSEAIWSSLLGVVYSPAPQIDRGASLTRGGGVDE